MLANLRKPDVPKLKANGDLKGLVKLLGYERDRDVRWSAVEALVEIGPLALDFLDGRNYPANDAILWGVRCVLGQTAKTGTNPALRQGHLSGC
jgi:hypothetical protein